MENYKGVYYNETKEQKFYEGGAHFKFKDLFNILKVLGGVLPEEDHINPSNSFIKNKNINKEKNLDLNINSIFNEEQEEKIRQRTRNINQFNYINNPNTQITFNKNIRSKNNNLSIKKSYMAPSRNIDKNSIFFDEINKNYNNINASTLNYSNKNNLKNNLTQTFLHKRRNNLNSEEKINKIDNNSHYIYLNNLKYVHNRNRSDAYIKSINNNLEDIKKYHVLNKNLKSSSKKIFIPKYKYNFNYSNNIYDIKLSQFNNNKIANNKLNIRKNSNSIAYGKDQNNYFKDKLDSNFLNNYNFLNYGEYSKNVYHKNMDEYKNTFELKKDNDYKGKYINNFFDSTNDNKIDYIKNSNSGMNMNKYLNGINGTINNKRYLFYNNLSVKNNLNINDKNLKNNKNDSLFQKYIKKRISQISIFNNNNMGDDGRNKSKNISRNIKNMSNNYNYNYTTQNFKFKTSSGIKYINKYNFKK